MPPWRCPPHLVYKENRADASAMQGVWPSAMWPVQFLASWPVLWLLGLTFWPPTLTTCTPRGATRDRTRARAFAHTMVRGCSRLSFPPMRAGFWTMEGDSSVGSSRASLDPPARCGRARFHTGSAWASGRHALHRKQVKIMCSLQIRQSPLQDLEFLESPTTTQRHTSDSFISNVTRDTQFLRQITVQTA